MFSFFDDFGIDVATNHGQLKQSPAGLCLADRAALWLPGRTTTDPARAASPAHRSGSSRDIRPVSGTNFVPRMSLGAELSVIMPIINAPFRLYYAYNPLRLYETALLQRREPGRRSN